MSELSSMNVISAVWNPTRHEGAAPPSRVWCNVFMGIQSVCLLCPFQSDSTSDPPLTAERWHWLAVTPPGCRRRMNFEQVAECYAIWDSWFVGLVTFFHFATMIGMLRSFFFLKNTLVCGNDMTKAVSHFNKLEWKKLLLKVKLKTRTVSINGHLESILFFFFIHSVNTPIWWILW